jgi:hypothetical protein
VLNFISKRAVHWVKDLVVSPQSDYRACEVSLPKVATSLDNDLLVEQDTQVGISTLRERKKGMLLSLSKLMFCKKRSVTHLVGSQIR